MSDKDLVTQQLIKAAPELSIEIIKKYICPNATDQEAYFFLQLCKAQGLNPFLREAYLIKYGTAPATLVTGKETFTKRADRQPQYNGFKAGVIVAVKGELSHREGSFVQTGETLLGGWAEVFRKDRDQSYRIEVAVSEYIGKKSDGSTNSQWSTRPATMIRKVALVQALREAFPEEFGGMYSEEEAVEAVPSQGNDEERPPIKTPRAVNQDQEQAQPETPQEEACPPVGDSTSPQHGAIFAILKKLGVEDEMEKHAKVSKVLGIDHVITSMRELSKKQASTAIEILGKEIK